MVEPCLADASVTEHPLDDLLLLSRGVSSSSIDDSLDFFANYLSGRGYQAIMFGAKSLEDVAKKRYLCLDASGSVQDLCSRMNDDLVLPFIENALVSRTPFEIGAVMGNSAIGLNIAEFSQLGHREIAVFPYQTGSNLCILVVGLGGDKFTGQAREYLVGITGMFMALNAERLKMYFSTGGDGDAEHNLSARELECIQWCANGKSSFEISRILSLSEHTINSYIALATRKLGATSRPHAVAKAMKYGLIQPSQVI